MRFLSIIFWLTLTASCFAQVNDNQLRVRNDQFPDSILIMSNDTNSSLPTYKTGKWRKASDLIGAVAGDTDWLKLDGATIPTNADSAKRSGYTLFTGLDGGLPTKIEMLKEGTIRFDQDDGLDSKYPIIFMPLQQTEDNRAFYYSIATTPQLIARNNDVVMMGWNLNAGGGLYADGDVGFGQSFENHYNNAGSQYNEYHLIQVDTFGVNRRPQTWLIHKYDPLQWAAAFHINTLDLRHPITEDNYIRFYMQDSTAAGIRITGSKSQDGLELFADPVNNNAQLLNFGMTNPALYTSSFYETKVNRLTIENMYTGFGDATSILGWRSDNKVVNGITTGWGIDLTSGVLLADSSQVATQYDLTLFGQDHDWYEVGGTSPPNDITDEMFHTGNVGIGISDPDVRLHILGTSTDIDNADESAGRLILEGDATNALHFGNNVSDPYGSYIQSGASNNPGTIYPLYLNPLGGNVGVGNQDPQQTLHVTGTARITGNSGTATAPAGRDADGDVSAMTEGWGINYTGGAIVVDSAQVATQYDLTQVTGVADGNGLFDPANEGDTAEVTAILVDEANGIYFDALSVGNVSYFGYEPSAGRPIVYSDRADDVLYMQNVHASQGTFIGLQSPGNGYKIGAAHGGDFYIQDGTIEPFYIEASTTVDNTLKLQADGDVQIADYPNSRDDTGTPSNFLSTDANGVILSNPISLVTTDTYTNIEVDGVDVSTNAPTLDFDGTDFNLTESPTDNFDITIQPERIQDLVGAMTTGNTETGITVTYQDADGTIDFVADDVSATNELNTIEEGNVSVQTGNSNLDFQTLFDLATDGGSEVNVSLDLSEATTVTAVESDDWLIMHDAGSSQHQKILWSDIHNDVISFYDGTVLQGTGNAIDVGEGLDINMVSTEANINLDASEFQIDGAAEGTEYVLIHDIDTTAGHQIQRRLVSSFAGGSDTNFAEDDLTYTGNRTHNASTFTTTISGSTNQWKIEDTNSNPTFYLEGNIGDTDAPFASLQFQYSDADFATDQTAWTIVGVRETDDIEHSTLEITANEAASAPPVATWENNENLSDNTQETSLRLNSGIAYTQYWESSTSNAITLDRGYYNVVLLSGHTGTITLPQIFGTDESNTEIDAAQVATGQEYVISNFSGSAVTIAAFNDSGAANDDYLNGTEAGTYSLANNDSVIVKAVTVIASEGRWFTYD